MLEESGKLGKHRKSKTTDLYFILLRHEVMWRMLEQVSQKPTLANLLMFPMFMFSTLSPG